MTQEEQTQGQQPQNGQSQDEQSKSEREQKDEEAKQKVQELEENPPEKLEDWPDDQAKYETFGGAEGNESYDESVTGKLGPSSLRYREDGSVEIEGEEVDNPDDYKAEPIPGGPTDPKLGESRAYGEPDLTDETSIDPESPPNEEGESSGGGDAEGGDDSDDKQQAEQS